MCQVQGGTHRTSKESYDRTVPRNSAANTKNCSQTNASGSSRILSQQNGGLCDKGSKTRGKEVKTKNKDNKEKFCICHVYAMNA
ncbi:hypothetical protein FR483_n661L [Paramecium bursaria Chlorella virus FR483]|uniref:Uncharacterized protein n661L n=1 Tax=Paramecium bursaria Chlorella virus FR483 TaxID=399781 RepID=A7J815_PBCVF|nr:hypothetical protein FR483_n661L [Paramecium bursaria Chlorella virus FR483]ABT15946.1 hypothetical protein FR483_n661L [Paramecium bursaria Chlorella virus FR483]